MKAKAASWFGALGGVLAVLVPKALCPLCVAASGSVLSALGLSFLADDKIMRWLLAGLLSIALLVFFLRARSKGRWGLFWVSVAGAALVYGGWFVGSEIALYSGTGTLTVAAVLNLRAPRDRTECAAEAACPNCLANEAKGTPL